MQFLIQFYPAIISTLSLYFYKRDSRWMQLFYRRMTFSYNFRKLFVLSLLFLLLGFNFLYLNTYGTSLGFYSATAICMGLFFFELTEKVFFQIQKRHILGMVMFAALISGCNGEFWPMAMNLYVVIIGSIFYPAEALLKRIADPSEFTRLAANGCPIIKDYYSR